MLDYSALLYNPVYAEIGVPCLFVSGALEIVLTVIDDTRPKILPAGSAEVRSVGPGAFVRIPELEENGIARDDWMDASLNFNGRSWLVRSYELRGSPNGEDAGEVRFLLKAAPPPIPTTPDWVPANAKIHIDFLGGSPQGRAWSNGAQVGIETLLGSDPNTENYWGPSSYDAGDLTADGLVYVTSPPALIGDALSPVLAGSTIRIQYKIVDTNNDEYKYLLVSADGNSAMVCAFSVDASLTSDMAGSTFSVNAVGTGSRTAGDTNAIAMTLTPASSTGRGELAFNGSEVGSDDIQSVDWPVGAYAAALVDPGTHVALQSITIYDPLPTTAGLSELSTLG